MATIHTIEQKKQAERRTALLGLAADQPAVAGVCPTSAEMAELVEDLCPPEKKEQFFRHIAVCKCGRFLKHRSSNHEEHLNPHSDGIHAAGAVCCRAGRGKIPA